MCKIARASYYAINSFLQMTRVNMVKTLVLRIRHGVSGVWLTDMSRELTCWLEGFICQVSSLFLVCWDPGEKEG